MSSIWFTADHHFGHKNVIKHANRPFVDVEEMDESMIAAWNEVVLPTDDVYHLGDVGLCSSTRLSQLLARLNGRIFLIRGNHEQAAEKVKDRFEWIKDYFELTVNDKEAFHGKRLIVLMHYAMRVWNSSHHGTWQLYGHSHGQLPDDPMALSLDVGVDCHDFKPISYQQVKRLMQQKQWVPMALRDSNPQ